MPDDLFDTCTICGKELAVTSRAVQERIKRSAKFRCRSCIGKNIWSNHSDQVKKDRSAKLSKSLEKYWRELPEDERSIKVDNLRGYNDEYWENCTDEDKEIRSKNLSESLKAHWANLSEEEKLIKLNELSTGRAEWWNNLSDEDKLLHGEKIRKL